MYLRQTETDRHERDLCTYGRKLADSVLLLLFVFESDLSSSYSFTMLENKRIEGRGKGTLYIHISIADSCLC